MRHLKILLLKWNGTTEVRVIPWGKKLLDIHRKEGDIIMSEEVYANFA